MYTETKNFKNAKGQNITKLKKHIISFISRHIWKQTRKNSLLGRPETIFFKKTQILGIYMEIRNRSLLGRTETKNLKTKKKYRNKKI